MVKSPLKDPLFVLAAHGYENITKYIVHSINLLARLEAS